MAYQTATPTLSAAEGIDLILSAVSGTLNPEPTNEYDRGLRNGVVMALESLLSDHEKPAREILDEALRSGD